MLQRRRGEQRSKSGQRRMEARVDRPTHLSSESQDKEGTQQEEAMEGGAQTVERVRRGESAKILKRFKVKSKKDKRRLFFIFGIYVYPNIIFKQGYS